MCPPTIQIIKLNGNPFNGNLGGAEAVGSKGQGHLQVLGLTPKYQIVLPAVPLSQQLVVHLVGFGPGLESHGWWPSLAESSSYLV